MSVAAEQMRTSVGRSAASLIDVTDDQLAFAMKTGTEVMGHVNVIMRGKGIGPGQRASLLIGIALASIMQELVGGDDA